MRSGSSDDILAPGGKSTRGLEGHLRRTDGPWLAALFDASRVGMLIVDRAQRVRRVNAAFRAMCRTPLVLGDLVDLAFSDADFALALRQSLNGAAPDGPVATRLRTGGRDGDRDVDVAIVALRDADGTVCGLHLAIAEPPVRARHDHARIPNGGRQSLGGPAGGVAHDFNNLLTAILAGADLALAREGIDGETREDLHHVRRAAQRGAALVRQLIFAGRRDGAPPPLVPVDEALQDLAGLLRRLAGPDIDLVLMLDASERVASADPSEFDRVVVNLVVNARDATPNRGTVTLRTAEISLPPSRRRGEDAIPAGCYVTVAVEDTGDGIPPDILPRIFDPFFTTKHERGGVGLGLSTVQSIMRQCGGYLVVDSEVGRGTTIRLYFPPGDRPAADRDVAATATDQVAEDVLGEPAGAAPAHAARTALLVEDEDAVRGPARRALVQRGWTVFAAASAEAALRVLEERAASGKARPAILVSDVAMPGMDGSALVALIRERWPSMPAMLVSGYAEETLRLNVALPDVAFLAKPYTLKALLAKMEHLLAESQRGEVSDQVGAARSCASSKLPNGE